MSSHSESTQVGGAAPVCHAGLLQPTGTQMTKSLSITVFKTSVPMGLGHINLHSLADIVPFPHWPKMNPMNTYNQSLKRSLMCAVLLNVLGYDLSLNCTPQAHIWNACIPAGVAGGGCGIFKKWGPWLEDWVTRSKPLQVFLGLLSSFLSTMMWTALPHVPTKIWAITTSSLFCHEGLKHLQTVSYDNWSCMT